MAYETGTATNLEDFLGKLDTFLVANGWTQDLLDNTNNEAAWHKNSVYISVGWNTGSSGEMSLHQATGYTGGQDPGDHPGDSGNGYNTAGTPSESAILSERCVNDIGNGPYPSYHFFEQDSGPMYVHVVLETSTDVFRHFGFGEIDKSGDWAGGEYCYGQYHSSTIAISSSSSLLLDGLYSNGSFPRRAATMRISGMAGQPVGSVWGQIWGTSAARPDDTATNAKVNIQGGFRAGPITEAFGWIKGTTTSGVIPGYPISLFYVDNSANFVYHLGYMADVRGVNIDSMAPADIVTIGGEDWVFFPTSQKTTVSSSNRSYNQGIMYRKELA